MKKALITSSLLLFASIESTNDHVLDHAINLTGHESTTSVSVENNTIILQGKDKKKESRKKIDKKNN